MADSTVCHAPTLDRWCQLSWTGGLQVDELAPLETITVRTRNTRYELIILSPATGEVRVRGGRFFPEFTQAHVAGSSLGGGCLKVRGIYVGFLLELQHEGQMVVTTRVQEVSRAVRARVH